MPEVAVMPVARRERDFARYTDPAGRFRLSYPRGWSLHAAEVVQTASPAADCLVRVDVLPSSPWVWRDLERSLVLTGIRLEIAASENHAARGMIQIGSRRLRWHAQVFRVAGGMVILSVGCRADSDCALLDRIRRAFRVEWETA